MAAKGGNDATILARLKSLKDKVKNSDTSADAVQEGALGELLDYLPSAPPLKKDIIEAALDVLVRIAWHCFYIGVPLESRKECIDKLGEVDGMNRLFALYNLYTSDWHREELAIVIARFYDHTPLNPDHASIIETLITTVESTQNSDKDLGRLNHAVCSIITIATDPRNKMLLINANIITPMLSLLTHFNWAIAENAAVVIQNACLVKDVQDKQRIINSSKIFSALLPHFQNFSKARSSDKASPVATVVKWLVAACLSVINNNPDGVEAFFSTGIIPLLVASLHATSSATYISARGGAAVKGVPGTGPQPAEMLQNAVADIQKYTADIFINCAQGTQEKTSKLLDMQILPAIIVVVRETIPRIEKKKNTENDDAMLVSMSKVLDAILSAGSKDAKGNEAKNIYLSQFEKADVANTLLLFHDTVSRIPAGGVSQPLTVAKNHAVISWGHLNRGVKPDEKKHGVILTYLHGLFDGTGGICPPDGMFNFQGAAKSAFERLKDGEAVLKEYNKAQNK